MEGWRRGEGLGLVIGENYKPGTRRGLKESSGERVGVVRSG